MCDASLMERSSIFPGMRSRQNSIVRPKTRVSTPAARRCAAAASPYGPAPTTTTSLGSVVEAANQSSRHRSGMVAIRACHGPVAQSPVRRPQRQFGVVAAGHLGAEIK
jgi:hypothetical protein